MAAPQPARALPAYLHEAWKLAGGGFVVRGTGNDRGREQQDSRRLPPKVKTPIISQANGP